MTLSGDDDDVPPQPNHYLDEMAYNSNSMNVHTEDTSIPEMTPNLDQQENKKDETRPSIGSENDNFMPVHPGK